MSESTSSIPPFRVVYSGRCRDEARQLLALAISKGWFSETAQAIREIDRRLHWIPLDFGEPLRDLVQIGIKEHIGIIAPLVVRYGVDEARRIVYVSLPFRPLWSSTL